MIPRRITPRRMPTPRPIFAPVERPPLLAAGLAIAEEKALPYPVEEDEADDVEDCISADDVEDCAVDVELEEELKVEVELSTSPIVV